MITFNGVSFYYTKISQNKIGFIVSKKFGNAFKRNQFKRRCRSLYSEQISNNNYIALVIKPNNNNYNFNHLKKAFNGLFAYVNYK